MASIQVFKDLNIIENSGISMNECRKLNKFTDLTLKSSDGEEIKVHKSVLCSSCPYFQSMFNSNFKEWNEDTIHLKNNIKMIDLEVIIEYLYTGEAKVPKDRSRNIYEKAHFFQLIGLQEFCRTLLIQEINDENCLEFLRYSELFSDDNLKRSSIQYIAKNADKLVEQYLTEFSNDDLEAIISDKELKICPDKMFASVMNWIKLDLPTRNVYIESLLNNVDLLQLSDNCMDETFRNSRMFSCALMKFVGKAFRELKSSNNLINRNNRENITVVVNRESPCIALSDALQMVNHFLAEIPGNVIPVHQQEEPQLPEPIREAAREPIRPRERESRNLRRYQREEPQLPEPIREAAREPTRPRERESRNLRRYQQEEPQLPEPIREAAREPTRPRERESRNLRRYQQEEPQLPEPIREAAREPTRPIGPRESESLREYQQEEPQLPEPIRETAREPTSPIGPRETESRNLRRYQSRTNQPSSSRTSSREHSGEPRIIQTKNQKRIFVAYNYSIQKLNLKKNIWEQQYVYNTDKFNYAIASHKNNIYLTGGIKSTSHSDSSNVVHCYNEHTRKNIRIPSMLEGRKFHRSISLNDKIYACGGETNRGSVEYFDVGKEEWIRDVQMKKSRNCFGLCANDGSIYAVGGTLEQTIERFDPRQGEWNIIGKVSGNHYRCKSFCTNNLLYSIDQKSSGFVYELRMLKLEQEIFPDFDIRDNNISWDRYDVVELEGNIYGIFRNQFYQYDEFVWKNLRPSYLKYGIDSINLCTL